MQQSMRSQATFETGVWLICFDWLWSECSSSTFQHLFQAWVWQTLKHMDDLWRSGISVHVGVVLLFEADQFLLVCTLLVIVCFFRLCSFYRRGAGEMLTWRLQATPAATPAGSFGGVACLQARNTRCNYCAWSQHLVVSKKHQELEPKPAVFTHWLTMFSMDSQ